MPRRTSPKDARWAPAVGAAGAAWLVAILMTFALGSWPVSPGIHGSADNLWHYAGVAIPALDNLHSPLRLLGIGLSYLLIVGVATTIAIVVRMWATGGAGAARAALLREVGTPMVILTAAMAYLLAGWWFIVPSRLAEGEPMHVNVDMIAWLMSGAIAGALCTTYETTLRDGVPGRRRMVAGSFASIALALCAFMVWTLNTQPYQRGGLPIVSDFNTTKEARLRDRLSPQIPEGHCFWYGRRYSIYVDDGEFDPDFAIAATGCPVLNGRRWRDHLGTNNPEAVRRLGDIPVISGKPFRVVDTCNGPPAAPSGFTATTAGSTVLLSWAPGAGSKSYLVESGSRPGGADIAPIETGNGRTSLAVGNVKEGTYFARVRGKSACGTSEGSNEIRVVVS
jgi:hypothetical protein